jgi:hypothetical protein
MNKIRVFLTYSWDGEEHQAWVQKLAVDLDRYRELHIICDIFDLDNETDKNHFMERAVHESDIVVVIATKEYKRKADARIGGVGIETYMTTIRHWEESNGGGVSRIILIQREKESAPRYLSGKFHIDFSVDRLYEKSLAYLVKALAGKIRAARPEKTLSVESPPQSYSFTRAEDILRLKHANRRPLIGLSEGTDFSGASRIKFELWETESPRLDHFLFLFDNITISQTIERLCHLIREKKLLVRHLIVLRSSKSEEGLIKRLLSKNGLSVGVSELTFADYLKKYCIDGELLATEEFHRLRFYTDQELLSAKDEQVAESAVEYLYKEMCTESEAAAHLVVATGGMGKSTLCHEVAASFMQQEGGSGNSVVLIKAESIRNNFSPEFLSNLEVRSVYDLYSLYARVVGAEFRYERLQFELSLLCGNLIVIVDGLDELSSILQERFDLKCFLDSIRESQQQMGRSKILLTSRNALLIGEAGLDDSIRCYTLLGFDERSRQKYIKKRFGRYDASSRIIEKATGIIAEITKFDSDHRVVPFFVDIVSTIIEDQIESREPMSFQISSDQKDYLSNSGLTDAVIFSVIKRERLRHGIDIPIKDIVNLFSEMAVECGESITHVKLRERLAIYYDEQAAVLFPKMLINPLFVQEVDCLKFRYHFLTEYFASLFIIQGIVSRSLSRELINTLAGQRVAQSATFRDVKTFFSSCPDTLHSAVKEIWRSSRQTLSRSTEDVRETELEKRALSTLLSLYADVRHCAKGELAAYVRDLYGIDAELDVPGKIDRLFIHGDFPVFDFSNLQIWYSRFSKYQGFVESKFANAKFFYCEFIECGGDYPSETFSPEMFETCTLGNLSDTVEISQASVQRNRALCEAEFKRFLRSFYRGASFKDQKADYIKFSERIDGLARRNFDSLIKMGLISLSVEKSDEKYFEISGRYRDSVFRFLNDDFSDGLIKEVISVLGH